jgi:hypothetical protein
VGIALLTGLIALKDASAQYAIHSAESDIGFFDHRFEGLRPLLPANGVVGYLSDIPVGDKQSTGEYYLAQYSLAPVVVVTNTDQRLVVGNFHTPDPDASLYTKQGLRPLANLGNGAWLFQKEGQ